MPAWVKNQIKMNLAHMQTLSFNITSIVQIIFPLKFFMQKGIRRLMVPESYNHFNYLELIKNLHDF